MNCMRRFVAPFSNHRSHGSHRKGAPGCCKTNVPSHSFNQRLTPLATTCRRLRGWLIDGQSELPSEGLRSRACPTLGFLWLKKGVTEKEHPEVSPALSCFRSPIGLPRQFSSVARRSPVVRDLDSRIQSSCHVRRPRVSDRQSQRFWNEELC